MKELIPHTLQEGMSQSGSYVLTLLEPLSRRMVPIVVGAAEAQAILIAQKDVKTRRPLTHDLMVKMMEAYGLTLERVVIDHVSEGVFYSTLQLTDGFNPRTLDCRTTDAIALALRTGAPIMADESVVEETAVRMPDSESPRTLEQLEDELRRCEEQENYERAAELQRKIDQMKTKQ